MVAGAVKRAEGLIQALIREIKEEVDMTMDYDKVVIYAPFVSHARAHQHPHLQY